MAAPPYYVTGDAIFPTNFWIAIQFPDTQSNWAYAALLAAINNMGRGDQWIWQGETTNDEAAQLFKDIRLNGIHLMAINIGDLSFKAAAPVNGTWLLCDGSAVSQTTYAALYAAVGTAYNTGGEPAGTFRVPNVRGRDIVMTNNGSGILPSWADTPGGTGGEATHTLTGLEVPEHTHIDSGHTHATDQFVSTAAGLEVTLASLDSGLPISSTGVGFANLNTAGLGGDHNNVQPSIAFPCYILADF